MQLSNQILRFSSKTFTSNKSDLFCYFTSLHVNSTQWLVNHTQLQEV